MKLIFLYDVTLKQHGKVDDLPRVKRPEQLPVVLSREEVAKILKVTYNLKHKALLMTAYSACLRVGEVVRLKVSEIDSKWMQIRVTAGKGAKDRLPHTPSRVCHAFVGRRRGDAIHSRAAGSRQHQDNGTLHARDAARHGSNPRSAGQAAIIGGERASIVLETL